VLRINDHKLNVDEVNAIKQKQSDKLRLDSEIKEITNSIYKKTIELNTQKFSSDTEKRAYKNQLDSLIRDKASKSSQYATIINELNILATQKPAALDEPKYRLRGFFAIPEPVFDSKKQKQSVIQFRIYWRYISPDGKNPVSEQIDFVEKSGNTRRGTYSNWNVLTTGLRSRFFNTTTLVYDWANEQIEDPEIVNINQIDISISKGESVQFYVKAIGEGGWPLNPVESDKINIITFDFPNDISTADSATTALKQSEEERVLLKLQNDIAARGLDVHLQSSFNTSDAYYAHNSEIISSGFFTNEGNVISLYEKLKELTIKVQDLENRLNKVVGNIKVYLIDDTTKSKVEIKNGDTFNLFAGYYKDFTNLLAPADRRGAIISKKWKIQLENGDATPLQLISRFPGGIADLLPDSSSVINPDSDYVNYRKYDVTPIVNTSIGNNDTNNANRVSTAFYQSGQLRGQYLYSRYNDIGLVNPLYVSNVSDNNAIVPTGVGAVVDLTIWDLGDIPPSILPSGNGKLNTFCIHTDHPLLNTGNAVTFAELQTPNINIDANGKPSVVERTSAFRHSFNFNVEGSLNNPTKQCKYSNNWVNATAVPNSSYTPTINMLPDKFGFIDNDRYLVGSDTCGAYFYVAPSTIESLMVDGSDARATRSVDVGETNAIVIPIILQFRMTDYFGPSIVGTVATGGDGIVGGYNPANTVQPQNITYVRKIGLDLYQLDKTVFSFDIQASATYQKDSLVQILDASVPVKTVLVKNIGIKKQFLKTLFE
jgi:hypothetical protein